MPDLKVVPIRDGRPSLNDITGRLRLLADQIEAGEHGDVTAAYVVIPHAEDFPALLGYGDIEGKNDPLIQIDLCRHWLLNNIVRRP